MANKRFIEQFEENVRLYPEKVILRDQESCVTFKELDELSGRVYAYLKNKGIGREDFVMIFLPRSIKSYIAMIGVWKAGAAMVLFEDDAPKERVEFITKDCNCKITISMDNWNDILQEKSFSDFEDVNPNNAAFVLYTSGSEGCPKGVIHEFGKIDLALDALRGNGDLLFKEDDRLGLPLPMNSTAAFLLMIGSLNARAYTDILPMSFIRNIELMESYVIKEKITITGLVPSMIMQNRIHSPYIRFYVTGTEMSSGVYLDDYPILNFYGQTEIGLTPITFVIDRAYENTPIGKPTGICNIYLLDDNDKPVAQNGTGEICYPYDFTRGYVNDPEGTSEVYRNGLYHTGDIATINEDGNYIILGRKSDMIKINGNRIEPAEIEAAVKRVLNIDWAFAKGFVESERSYICVYYTDDIDIDYSHVHEELLQILPDYMIPSYFVHVDEVPHLPNGKINRKAFKAPDIASYFTDYVAPTNELEELLCSAMQEVLSIERIGINDDFYLLGGDSLRTIKLIGACGIEGLNVSDIYKSRTPASIAEQWMLKQFE